MQTKEVNSFRGYTTLDQILISKANIQQRKGRAGRVAPGFHYNLLPREIIDQLVEHRLPEMQRLPLDNECITNS